MQNSLTLADHAWIVFVLMTCGIAFYIKFQSKRYIAEDPSLKAGYEKLFKGTLTYLNIPWIVLGVCVEIGRTPLLAFNYPRTGNIWVLIFHGVVVGFWILTIWWVYFAGGAEFLARHPGILEFRLGFFTNRRIDRFPAVFYKIVVGLMLLGGVYSEIMMWTGWFLGY